MTRYTTSPVLMDTDRRRYRADSHVFLATHPLVMIFMLCSVSLLVSHMHHATTLGVVSNDSAFEDVLRNSRTSMSRKATDVPVATKKQHAAAATTAATVASSAPRSNERNKSQGASDPISLTRQFDGQKQQALQKNNAAVTKESPKPIPSVVASNTTKEGVKVNSTSSNSAEVKTKTNSSDKIETPIVADSKKETTLIATDATDTKQEEKGESPKPGYRLAGLNCDAQGGPSNDIAKEMVYWEDIPSDNRYVSIYKKEGVTQYVTFEADDAGWNNQRMAVETIVAFAIVTGRTLVIPPAQYIWNLDKNVSDKGSQQRAAFSFSDFFPFRSLSKEHAGLEIISTQEFLEREGITGNMRDNVSGQVKFPPKNRTNWDGQDQWELNMWLRDVSVAPLWNPDKCMLVFPATKDPKDLQALLDIKTKAEREGGFPKPEKYIGKPNPVNASAEERMKENWAEFWIGGKQLCTYNATFENAQLLHFPIYREADARMLTHFYAFLFFQDWRVDLWVKRFVRDHLRYMDDLQCVAARIIKRLRDRARARGDTDGNFEGFHVRREDFAEQFRHTITDANRIFEVSREVLLKNATVYIASDERNRSFFDPLREHYDVVFLEDFQDLLVGLNTNYYGMVEQLVVSRARSFFGCWQSSFTNYINRIRGYHANKAKIPGYEQGIIPSWYYTTEEHRNDFQSFSGVYQGYYYREFPTSWRLIDTGIEEMEDLIRPR